MRGLPLSVPDKDTEPFWTACAAGRLLIQTCEVCGENRWPPGPICPACGSPQAYWIESSGVGTVYSWVVVRVPLTEALADRVPYAVGLVELDEGVRIVSTISDCDVDEVRAGMPVRIDFAPAATGGSPFTFVPA